MQKHSIKFGDVEYDRKTRDRYDTILRDRQATEGRYVAKFEYQFGELFGFKHVIATSSGTTAAEVLWMAVAAQRGLDWANGYVITPALAFGSTVNSILRAGRDYYLVDIEPDLNMALPPGDHISNAAIVISNAAIGLQFVANMGRVVRMDLLAEYARQWGLFFAVDACEAHGAMLGGEPIAQYADAAIYSFYPAHIMTCGAEGGAIATDDDELANLCRSIKSHGRPPFSIEHRFLHVGTNAKWNEFAAARALADVENFAEIFARRRHVRNGLLYRLAEFPLRLYHDAEHEIIAPHAFPLLSGRAPELMAHLAEWTIEFKPLWGPLSNHAAHQSHYKAPRDYFKNALEVGLHGLHFGCHQGITEDDLDYIHDVFKLFYR
jgi:dTDP-4-amino-4,6-dideoxygalactose transaminase